VPQRPSASSIHRSQTTQHSNSSTLHFALPQTGHIPYFFPSKARLLSLMETTGQTKARFSIPSIIAIIAAFASFGVGAFGGFILAIVAIIFGLIGLMLSMAPSVRGGVVSMLSLGIACIAIVAAVIKAIQWAF